MGDDRVIRPLIDTMGKLAGRLDERADRFKERRYLGGPFGMDNSILVDTDLSRANLSKARNYQIDASQNVLKGARFSLPEAMSLLYSMDIILDGEEDIFSNT